MAIKLSPRQQEALFHRIAGKTYREIGEMMGISRSAACQYVSEAKARKRGELFRNRKRVKR